MKGEIYIFKKFCKHDYVDKGYYFTIHSNKNKIIINEMSICSKCNDIKYDSHFNDDYSNSSYHHIVELPQEGIGKLSDGYHTFDELYHHRAILFSCICNSNKDIAWKSLKHSDGTMYPNMFIVGINTPFGPATYHYDMEPYWKYFYVKELETAPEWDGHTPEMAIERILKFSRMQ